MRRVLIFLVVAIVIGVIGAGVALFLTPAENYRDRVAAAVQAATGRTLTINGPMAVTFAGTELVLRMDSVSLAREGEAPLESRRVEVVVEPFPLLIGALVPTRLTLQGAAIPVAQDKTGHWQMAMVDEGTDIFAAVPFGDVTLEESGFYEGEGASRHTLVEARRARARWSADDEVLNLQGSFRLGSREVSLDGLVERRRVLFTGGRLPIRMAFESALGKGALDGDIDLDAATFEGGINLTAPSARRLAAAMGVNLPGDRGLGVLSLSAAARVQPGAVHLREAKFTLDAMTGSGALGIVTTGTRPNFAGSLSVDAFDLSPYLALEEPEGEEAVGWSTAAMDLSGLKDFEGTLQLTTRQAMVGGLRFDNVVAAATVTAGKADVQLQSASAYAGLTSGQLQIDASGDLPRFALSLQLNGFDAQSFLDDAVDSQSLTGRGDISISLTGRGASRAALARTLGGTIEMKLIDGYFSGADLAAIARSIAQPAVRGQGEDEATDFNSLLAKVTIRQGQGTLESFKLIGPFLNVVATGELDFGARAMTLHMAPRFVNDIDGRAGSGEPDALAVPFLASGSWDAPTLEPDWPALAAQVRAGEVSEASLGTLPDELRVWFLAAMKNGSLASETDEVVVRP